MKSNIRNRKIINKFKNMSFVKKNLLLIMCCFLLLTLATIGYAALNQNLNISGDLVLRAVKDIRISDLRLVNTGNGGYELYNSKYTVDTITLTSNLLEPGSSITYQATITNYGNVDMEISSISNNVNTWFAECTINGLAKEDIIDAGTSKTFTITLKKPTDVVTTEEMAGVLIELGYQEAKTRYLTYTISGNSVQNGTPSPDNPVAIESMGDKINNLVSKPYVRTGNSTTSGITFTLNDNGSITVSGTATADIYYPVKYLPDLTSGKTYTISGAPKECLTVKCELYLDDGKSRITNASDDGDGSTFILTDLSSVSSNPGNYRLYIKILKSSVIDNLTFYPHLEEGAKDSFYGDYGYRIAIRSSSKNLLNKNDSLISGIKNNESFKAWGDEVFDNDWILKNLQPSTTYTISFDAECINVPTYTSTYSNNVGFFLHSTASGYTSFEMFASKYLAVGETLHVEKTFTTPSNLYDSAANYVVRAYTNRYHNGSEGVVSSMKFSNIQIEKGNSATAYAPYVEPEIYNIYLDAPLRKVGNVSDTIDYASKTITRNVQKMIINGTESGWKQTAEYPWRYFLPVDGLNFGGTNSNKAISNYFQANTDGWSTNISGRIMTNSNRFTLTWDSTKTLDDFKAFLKEKEDASNPVEIDYVLDTPIIEEISLPEIIKKPYYTEYEIVSDVTPGTFTYKLVEK